MAVVIETTLGDLAVDLFVQERPRACQNFLKLCKLKYYNYNLFHNIEHGFIAQTGDPTGAGDGGESVWGVVEGVHKKYFEAESLPKIKHSAPGLLSLVSLGKNMVGSQFFFTLGPDLISLDGMHCVIGEVTEGSEVLRKLNEAIVDDKYRPYQDIRITHTVVLEDPFDDPRGFQIPSRSPSPSAERLKNGRIGADEDIDDTEGKSAAEIQEMLQEREAKARATILEIVGDLPDADIAPPENVLFVCKLNPVTTDDDLEIIFSRFGKVKDCEVIRDKITGDSLQYAFVEFDDKKACENAYFKMDNVLIDDRRIHVDFSQSVAKVRWRGKGRGIIHEDGKDGKLDFNDLRGTGRSENRQRSPFKRRDDRRQYSNNRYQNRGRDSDRRSYQANRQNRSDQRSRSRSGSKDRQSNRRRSDSRSPAADQRRRTPPQRDFERRRFNNRQQYNRYDRRDQGRYSYHNQRNNNYQFDNYRRRQNNFNNNNNRDRYNNRSNNRNNNNNNNRWSRSASPDGRQSSRMTRNRSRDHSPSPQQQQHNDERDRSSRKFREDDQQDDRNSRRSRDPQVAKRKERSDTTPPTSSKKKKNNKRSNRKRESLSSDDSDTSDSSSTSSSSSSSTEEEKRKRKKSKNKNKKNTKKSKRRSSTSSDSSSD